MYTIPVIQIKEKETLFEKTQELGIGRVSLGALVNQYRPTNIFNYYIVFESKLEENEKIYVSPEALATILVHSVLDPQSNPRVTPAYHQAYGMLHLGFLNEILGAIKEEDLDTIRTLVDKMNDPKRLESYEFKYGQYTIGSRVLRTVKDILNYVGLRIVYR